ncbi:MFS transporter [Roseateles sp. BYS78W]|uniref:MFS transporter n=1 Tax=Pelomonas candidula TaxID=3299025 RepID=A0ABW7HH73_9BURK
MPLPILALALAAFAIGTTEFVIMGILPDVAADLGVSLSLAGLLVTGYAGGVAVGAPLIVWATARWPRKAVLLTLLGVFIAGNLLSALAPGYGVLMVGRVIASFAHGSFFGIGAVVATSLVPAERRASAISLMFSGLTLANVLGVPVGTLIGQWAGWRATFLTVVVLGALAFAAVAALLPACPATSGNGAGRPGGLWRAPVLLGLVLTAFSFGGVFTGFTYIAPMLSQLAGLSPSAITGCLFLFGLGLTVGNSLGGRLADWRLMPSLVGILAVLTVVELLLTQALVSPVLAVPAVFLWGVAAFSVVPGLQANVVGEAGDAAALASTLNVSAFNVGNAAGAWLGSALIAADVSLRLLPAFAAGMSAIALALASFILVMKRRA